MRSHQTFDFGRPMAGSPPQNRAVRIGVGRHRHVIVAEEIANGEQCAGPAAPQYISGFRVRRPQADAITTADPSVIIARTESSIAAYSSANVSLVVPSTTASASPNPAAALRTALGMLTNSRS
jgi:hypothetical protein